MIVYSKIIPKMRKYTYGPHYLRLNLFIKKLYV